jgi:hypothetical protein
MSGQSSQLYPKEGTNRYPSCSRFSGSWKWKWNPSCSVVQPSRFLVTTPAPIALPHVSLRRDMQLTLPATLRWNFYFPWMLSYAKTNISTSLIQSPFIDANLNHSHLYLVLTTDLLTIHFLLSLLNHCSPTFLEIMLPIWFSCPQSWWSVDRRRRAVCAELYCTSSTVSLSLSPSRLQIYVHYLG